MTEPEPLVRLRGIDKRYAGVHALRGVDLDVFAGEVHCLLGENGAGKSTLIRVLAGATPPDGGEILAGGASRRAFDPAASQALGIGVVHQEIDLVPFMTVAENVGLGEEPVTPRGLLDRRALRERAEAALASFDRRIDPGAIVGGLAPAEQQLVQIARSLARDQRVLILDEPTASLSSNEVDHLLDLVAGFRDRGMAVVYISHRMEEIRRVGDRVTILRDGERVHSGPLAEISDARMITLMVGREVKALYERAPHPPGEVALSVRGLSLAGEFDDVSLEVRRGEVVALAGLVGAGRSALLEAIFGLRRPDRGEVRVDGRPAAIASPAQAIALGLGLVPEERRSAGLVVDHGVGANIVLPVLGRLARGGFLARARARALGREMVDRLAIKTPNLAALAGTLSGGNQQKVVLAKWLAADTRVLLLDEPTRGVDVGAKVEIYRLVDALAAEGLAVLFVSSELPEVMGLSDRVLVMCEGRMTAELETARTSQVEIMKAAVPRRAPRAAA